jgi:MFS superfamily sulfate permease-like transporter
MIFRAARDCFGRRFKKVPPLVTTKSLVPGRGRSWYSYAREDAAAGAVVFLVAVPLCLGIAQASDATPLAGMIAGIVGGIVVPLISRSPLSVSGPAAGLTVLVATAIKDLGFPAFLTCLVIAGMAQVLLGTLRAGLVAHFLPASVIKGMLAAIGLLIVLKQLPHAVGFDTDFEGDESFREVDGHNTLSAIVDSLDSLTAGAIVIALFCAIVSQVWPRVQKRFPRVKVLPVPLLIVITGALVALFAPNFKGLDLSREHFVNLPRFDGLSDLRGALVLPDFSRVFDGKVWSHALAIAIVASVETLLSIEAIDRLDPHTRISPPNRELIAQGVANGTSALLGGIPITSVIVRSSANLQAGGKTRLAALIHGVLLLVGLLLLAPLLNSVPLAALAVVLIQVGLKLSSVSLWTTMWKSGWTQFVPFAVTVVAILGTDLLKGTLLGAAVGLAFLVRAQQKNAIAVTEDGGSYLVTFTKDITFLQKARIKEILRTIPDGAYVTIDRRRVAFVDDDVDEILDDFGADAAAREIQFEQTFEPGGESRRIQRQTLRAAASGGH